MNEILPELKNGDVLISASGRKVIVKRVRNRLRDSAFEEPIYQLIYLTETGKELTGNARWTFDELDKSGMTLA